MNEQITVELDHTAIIYDCEINVHALHNGRGILLISDGDADRLVNIMPGDIIMLGLSPANITVIEVNRSDVVLDIHSGLPH